jgi:prepilin-type N-terminal cleavage/methylation domain-containing protein
VIVMLSGIKKRSIRGFTLVELMITLVIIAIGVGLALPSWDNAVQKRNVTSAAEEVAAFISYSQSQAVKSNQEVTVTFKRVSSGTNWCVGAIDETAKNANNITHCECDVAVGDSAHCLIDGQSNFISQGSFEKLKMDSSSQGGTASLDFFFNFDPIRGIRTNEAGNVVANDNLITLASDNTHHKLQVEVSVTGRVRICSPIATQAIPGFKACT